MENLRVIISGGGTGGHIFPAISIANAIKEELPNAKILFVGAKDRREMEKVPAAGYEIIGIPARGLKRPLYSLSNISVAINYLKCRRKAKRIIKEFKPNLIVGVGGYASASIVGAAASLKIPVVLQEQNSFAGIVNRKNGSKADKICVAYDQMERFFPKEKIILTGNPIRKEIVKCTSQMREEGIRLYNLDSNKRTVFIVGGSLGCKTLNESVKKIIIEDKIANFQVIWQCGKAYKKEIDTFLKEHKNNNIYCTDFIERIDLAYAAADIVVSRAGAGTISELCVAGKATIFIPSPNVAEDHQTHNAMALVNKNAAEIVRDSDAKEELIIKIEQLLNNTQRIKELEENIQKLAKPKAREEIAKICIESSNFKNEIDKRFKNVYFIGIGGIGMSAIARYYNNKGYKVSGYDKTPSELTKELETEGIKIHYEDDITKVPLNVKETLVIYTPAIPTDLKELVKVNNEGYTIVKRSKALGIIAKDNKCIAVSGSHGKTTTSTLLSHIYTNSGIGCNAFLGGISKNYDSNLITSNNNILIAEADEFDRSFHQLFPHIAIITATDPDHLDIYGTVENMREAFAKFASQVDSDGYILIKSGTEIKKSDIKAKILYYSYNKENEKGGEESNFWASDIKPVIKDNKESGLFSFTLNYPKDIIGGEGRIEGCILGIPGWLNIENAVAASGAALLDGVKPEMVKEALKNFMGVKRRMDIHINNHNCLYIDDYAHHPKEILSTITSIKESFPNRKLTGVFQPHLYTRTRDFAAEFAQSLSKVDSLILLDIYPARENPIAGVTSKIILDQVEIKDKILISKEELLNEIKNRKDNKSLDILITFGAGDIDRYIKPITEILTNG